LCLDVWALSFVDAPEATTWRPFWRPIARFQPANNELLHRHPLALSRSRGFQRGMDQFQQPFGRFAFIYQRPGVNSGFEVNLIAARRKQEKRKRIGIL